jgi:hypothetical protein
MKSVIVTGAANGSPAKKNPCQHSERSTINNILSVERGTRWTLRKWHSNWCRKKQDLSQGLVSLWTEA